MNKVKFLAVMALFLLASVSTLAQKEITREEYEKQMAEFTSKKKNLEGEAANLQKDIDNLKKQLESIQSYENCIEDLYKMVGATKADVEKFGKMISELESKIKRCEPPKADRQKDLDALKDNKISALPQYYKKVHEDLQKMLNQCEDPKPQSTMYKVVPGDCLWCIAAKNQFYGEGRLWPAIYDANRDVVGANPNLIYPNQEFKIPSLSDNEKDLIRKQGPNYKSAPTN